MDTSIEHSMSPTVGRADSKTSARPTASSAERTAAFRQGLGVRWPRKQITDASALEASGLVRAGVLLLSTSRLAERLKTGFRKIRDKASDELDADAASWQAFIEQSGLTGGEASMQGWDRILTQLRTGSRPTRKGELSNEVILVAERR